MHLLDEIVIGLYMAVLVGIGMRVSRRQRTTDQYFLAERSIPGWAIGMSLLATIITSVTFIAYPGAAYAGNWSLLVPGIMFVLVIAGIGVVVVPFFRQVVAMSVYEYFGKRFGSGVRMYSSFAFAMGHFSKMGFVFYLLALSVGGITGWSLTKVIIVLGIITIFYTLIGGLEAVIWTDVIQGFVLWSGVAVSIGLLLFSPRVHTGEVLHLIAANHKTSLGSMSFDLHTQTFWTMAIYGLFFYLQKYTADQTVVQRYLAATTDRAALRGIGMGAMLCLPVWTAFMFIGSLLWAFYRITGEHLPKSITKPDQIFPHFMVTQMPPGVAGLFMAALFGAAMSMLASDLNCLAVIVVEDFYGYLLPGRTDRQRLRVGKVAVAVSGLLAIAVALRLSNSQGSALALYYLITAVVAGGLAGLFLLAFLVRKAGRAAGLIGIVVNLVFTTWATLTMNHGHTWNLHQYNYPWHEFTIGAIGNILLFVVGYLASLALPASEASGATLWDWLAQRRSHPQHPTLNTQRSNG
ncbi:sodium/solute symporter [Granulicella sp. WH15]|uniref:sodium:solute symporter n=1 Tax=Granulicella sp. WH15 TaxID=2602070 RepID=UPI001366F8FF|nr:sodium:solute symporter [Granulicella sp. WH15]QHN03007.1 sodium/solute symporter [Granulicella sp. WH15]